MLQLKHIHWQNRKISIDYYYMALQINVKIVKLLSRKNGTKDGQKKKNQQTHKHIHETKQIVRQETKHHEMISKRCYINIL